MPATPPTWSPPPSFVSVANPAPARPSLSRSQILSAARRELASRSLAEFVRQAWPVIEPGVPLVDNWHIDAVCEALEAVTRGELRRLAIAIPPGHMKSTIASVCWPAWTWLVRPEWKSLFASHSLTYSMRDSVKTRLIVESDWYRQNFSEPAGWRIADDQNTKGKFENTRRGARELVAMNGGTGARGNSVLVDDPLSQMEAASKLDRERVIEWWDKTMSTRLNDMATGAHVIIAQRLHRQDLTGHVLERGGYEYLCLPAEYDSDRKSVVHVQLGERVGETVTEDRRTVDDELLFPAKFPADVIADLKRTLGSDGAAGQLGQDPVAEGGSMFKRWWWRFWKASDLAPPVVRPRESSPAPAVLLPARFDAIELHVDCAFDEGETNSRVAIHVWGRVRADYFLLDRDTRTMDFTGTIAAIKAMLARWPQIRRKRVEKKANGAAVINTLNREIGGFVPVNPTGSKEARASAVTPLVEAGNVFLPEAAPWIGEYVDELAAFPKGKHDDDVDTTSQALNEMQEADAVARARMLATL